MNFIALDGRKELNRSQGEEDEGRELDYRFHLGAAVCPFLPPSLFYLQCTVNEQRSEGAVEGGVAVGT